jgi:hypothetical protein
MLEQVWYRADRESRDFAAEVLNVMESLGDKYQIDDRVSKYTFSGREKMDIPLAIEVKQELEKIDELIEQLKEAAKTAQIGLIDMEGLAEFAPAADLNQLEELLSKVLKKWPDINFVNSAQMINELH